MEATQVSDRAAPTLRDGEPAVLLRMYRAMVRIRAFEEEVAKLVEQGEIRTPCHLYIGQEAVAAGVCEALAPGDTVWGTHRSHGHYLAKGGDLRAMMAEIFGKVTGCSGGRGGSMHLIAPEAGILGTVPIVAGTVPLAVGAGLASKLRGDRSLGVAFFGDGAMDEGHVHESLNLAALYRLPVIFVCENNLYASHMHLLERRPLDNLCEIAAAHGLASLREDGNDVLAVYRAACEAVARARQGEGPTFLEFQTFRWRGHVGPSWDMDVGVRRRGELKDWLARDPIARARSRLTDLGVPLDSLLQLEVAAIEEVREAVIYARQSASPDPGAFLRHVFADDQ